MTAPAPDAGLPAPGGAVRGSLRVRILLMFLGSLGAALALAGLALWRAGSGGTDAAIQGALLAGFGLTGIVTGLWYLFDQNIARPIEALAGALRTGRVPDLAQSRYLADLGPAARDAALARQRSDEALDAALEAHAAELAREKASLESILADFGSGAVMADARGRVVFYNASAARLLPGLALDGMLDRLLTPGALRAARVRLAAGAGATDLTCLTAAGLRLSGRLRPIDSMGEGGLLLILRDAAVDRPAPRATLEALRRHAATLVPMLDALDGPIPPALALAIRAEGQGLASTTRTLSQILASDAPAQMAGLDELAAGLTPAGPLPRLAFRAEAAGLNALLLALDARLRDLGHAPVLAIHPDQADQMRLALEWSGAPVPIDLLEAWLTDAPDPGQPDLTGTEILARHGTGIWPEASGPAAALVMPLPLAEGTVDGSGVTYDFALAARGVASSRLADLTCVVFDTETTGLNDHDAIVQIAGLRLARGRLTGERFDTLVNPGRPIPPGSTAIHHITDAMVADAPDLTAALTAFRHFCDDSVLIAHNAPFDMGFLRRARAQTGAHFDNRVLDTVALSAMVWGQSAVHTLDALTERLGIEIPPEARHTAMGDTVATAEAFLKLIPALEAKGITRFEEAWAEARRHRSLIADANLPD
ncbi:3'-5' exonuclease [Paracoccus gahaiensis]|uniref:DNA-directed DNA polymerase n=1 Tax=Paracoccus gahaiensis TaxID=1706839 RepID=A0A4U0REZ6_9RHOB|nr:3'-5' exonuclease [Paracoccus gahaiensis]TJZ94009.1 3'-5' exonuclease [Paracoccus gahaiensis]